MCFKRPFLIPITMAILSATSIALVFYYSVEEELVYPILASPGDLLPVEKAGKTYRRLALPSYIYQWFLLMFSVSVSLIIYIRYRQLRFVCNNPNMDNRPAASRTTNLALCVGFMMAASIMMLPYCIHYFTTQYLGIVVWLLILFYEILDVFLSYLMYQEVETKIKIKAIIFFKMLVVVISTVTLFVSKIFWEIAVRKFAPERLGSNYTSWNPMDWGYDAHFISAVSEWVFAIATFVYFCVLLGADLWFVHFSEPEVDVKCARCR